MLDIYCPYGIPSTGNGKLFATVAMVIVSVPDKLFRLPSA